MISRSGCHTFYESIGSITVQQRRYLKSGCKVTGACMSLERYLACGQYSVLHSKPALSSAVRVSARTRVTATGHGKVD